MAASRNQDELATNESIQQSLADCLVRHHGFANLSEESVLAEYKTALLGIEGNRFGIEFPHLSAYSADTIRILQSEVLHKHPQWIIVIAPACTEVSLGQVRTSDGKVIEDLVTHMQELRNNEACRRDASSGVTDRQYEWITKHIGDAVAELREGKEFVLVGVFDRVPLDKPYFGAWLLSESAFHTSYVTVDGLPPVNLGSFPVNAAAEVFRKPYQIVGGSREYLDTPYVVECWKIPRSYAGDFLQVVNENAEKIIQLPFDRTKIVKDSSLQKAVTQP